MLYSTAYGNIYAGLSKVQTQFYARLHAYQESTHSYECSLALVTTIEYSVPTPNEARTKHTAGSSSFKLTATAFTRIFNEFYFTSESVCKALVQLFYEFP